MNTATPVHSRTLGFVLLLLAALTTMVVATPVGETWVRQSQLPTGEQLHATALNDLGTCVVVGNHGTILTSTTGTSWTIVNSGVTGDLQDVIWAGSRFIAVGFNGTIIWSVDGSTWTKVPTIDAALTTVTWTGSLAVAVGGTFNTKTQSWGGAIFTSPDGLAWTRQTVTGAPYFFAVGWNGSVIAAAGNGTAAGTGAVYTSTNGTSWTKRLLPNHGTNKNNSVSSITSVGGTFLLTGAGAWTSSNGTTWTLQSAYDFLIGMIVRWTGTEFVATHNSGLFYTSATGGFAPTWADRSGGLLAPPLGGGRVGTNFIAVSYGGHIGRQATTGLGTWTSSHTIPRAFTVKGLAHSGSLYVAVGGNMSWTSTDGSNWTSFAQTDFDARGVTWDGTQFIAAGNGAWTSTNGSTWTNTLPPDTSRAAIFFSAFTALGKIIISGYNSSGNGASYSAISTDHGTTWNAASMPMPCLAMTVNGSTIFGVGWFGSVMTSTTGTSWTLDNAGLPSGDDFTALTFSGGQFVAGTSYGNIYTSATGLNWTFRDVVPSSVKSIARTTNEYIITGDRGLVARSFEGFHWRVLDSFTSVDILRLNWDGTRLVAAADEGNFFTSDGTTATRTEVAISAPTPTMAETGGTAQITVSLPTPWPIDVGVPLSFSGTAIKGTDYTVPADFIIIPKGSTSASLTLTAKTDLLDENDETIIVTALAPTGDVILGSTVTATVTITDDDTKPTFGAPMADQLVAVGSPFVFSAPATGTSAISYQWKKNNGAISGAKASSYSVTKAALTNAGEYAVEAKNLSGTVVSPTAKLGVVTMVDKLVTQKTGTTGTFTASAAGAVGYHWKRGTTLLSDGGNITGATSPKLVITGMTPADTNSYTCDITMGSLTMTSSTYDFGIIDAVPTITKPTNMTVRVSQSIDFTATCTNRPHLWKITNLPAGLQYSTTTGRITGKPTTVGTKTVTLVATNLYGPSASETFDITVEALPSNTLGSFVALLPRNAVNQNLGGRLDVTTTPNGRYTAKLWNGGDSYSLDTFLNGDRLTNPTGHVHIVRPAPKAALDLDFSIDLMTGGLTASVTDGSTTATGTGLARVAATTNRTGAYNIALSPVTGSPSGTPEGHSYAQFTVASSGTFSAVGKLADNTAFTIATQIAADGSIPLFLSLYSGKGSIHGGLTLHEDAASSYANNFITGSTTWFKDSVGTGRSYASGFPLFIQVADGGRYSKPTSGIVMNLTAGAGNAQVRFAGANLSTASRNPDGDFTVASIAAVTKPVPNVTGTTLVFDTTKGLVSGQFTLSDLDTSVLPNKTLPRTTNYYGIIIRPSGLPTMKAFGYFNLAQMPTAMPKTTSSTSPQLSGAVIVSPP